MVSALAFFSAILVALPIGLAIYSWLAARAIERRHPPRGRMAVVGEDSLHVVDLPARRGDAPTILLLHGASGHLEDLRQALGSRLEGRYRLIFVDRPGHGYSPRSRVPMHRPADQARSIAACLERAGAGSATVVGFSWGASVAAALGVLHPEKLEGLVFLAPATHPWPGRVRWYYRLGARPMLGQLFAWTLALPIGRMLIDDAVRSVFRPNAPPDGYRWRVGADLALRPSQFVANSLDVAGFSDAVAELSPRYGHISAPVEIVTGDRDGIVAPALHAAVLERAIPRARLTVLEGIGHMPHWVALDETVAAIERAVMRARRTEAAAAE